MLREHRSRYLAATAGSTLLNIGAFFFFSEILGLWYVVASVLAFSMRSASRYLMFRLWVFEVRDGTPHSLIRFLVAEGLGLATGTIMLYVLVEYVFLPPLGALLITLSLLYVLTYLMMRRVFQKG